MRQIVLDTETTGLETSQGHRVIEIGCVELIDRKLTGHIFHEYMFPDRDSDEGALGIHGITTEFLADKPPFSKVIEHFIEYIKGAELLIHNAPFDVGFLNSEFALASVEGKNYGSIEDYCTVLDTLTLARNKHPGQKNNLDTLCKRYDIDNTDRDLHSALLDVKLLAEVYLRMTGGQRSLSLGGAEAESGALTTGFKVQKIKRSGAPLKVIGLSEEELNLHIAELEMIDKSSGGKCLWRTID